MNIWKPKNIETTIPNRLQKKEKRTAYTSNDENYKMPMKEIRGDQN